MIEGTVTKLTDEEGIITGVVYKDKQTEEIKVRWRHYMTCMQR